MTDAPECTIRIYRESPLWDRYERWFNLPLADLNELFVVAYIIAGEAVDHADVERCAAELRQQHPNCVFVY